MTPLTHLTLCPAHGKLYLRMLSEGKRQLGKPRFR